jgi:hypothetical protein
MLYLKNGDGTKQGISSSAYRNGLADFSFFNPKPETSNPEPVFYAFSGQRLQPQ